MATVVSSSARPTIARRSARFLPRRRTLIMLLTHAVLLGCGFLWVFPFLWALGSSFKSPAGFFGEGLSIIPKEFEWSNYVNAWTQANFGGFFFNTIFTTVCTVVLTLVFTGMAGYVLARTRFPGKGLVLGIVALTLFLPHGYTILPVFDIVQRLGLLNTLWSIIIVNTANSLVLNTFLFFGYFKGMVGEMEEAARIDGAGFNRIFWQVMFPLAGPMIATVALFTFINSWNNFFVPLIFTLGRPDLQTLTVGMASFITQNSTNWTYLCAGSIISLAPIMLVFILLQRFFVEGIAGAVKA